MENENRLKELFEVQGRLINQIEAHKQTEQRLLDEYNRAFAERTEMDDFVLDMDSYRNELERDIEINTALLSGAEGAALVSRKSAKELKKQIKMDRYNIEILDAMNDKANKQWLEKNNEVCAKRVQLQMARNNVSCHEHKLRLVQDEIAALIAEKQTEEEKEG